jgi:hypothetical protein
VKLIAFFIHSNESCDIFPTRDDLENRKNSSDIFYVVEHDGEISLDECRLQRRFL